MRSLLFFVFFSTTTLLFAQPDTTSYGNEKGPAGLSFAVSDAELFDQYLPRLEFLDRSSRDLIMEQNLKAYMMPPRSAVEARESVFYALASCMEFYVNVDDNYKVNLSPDFIRLGTSSSEFDEILSSLHANGTISAAIMPFGSRSIPAGVGATQRYRIGRYFELFGAADRNRQKILHLRKALLRGNPVLVFMNVNEEFSQISEQRFYTGGTLRETKRQPFVVVGFDEDINSVEVLGYYGRTWGDNGYLWIDYDDFAKMADAAFVLQMEITP